METGMLTASIVLWVIFLAASCLSVGLGMVLAYHLFAYASKRRVALAVVSIYLCVSILLLICLLALVLAL